MLRRMAKEKFIARVTTQIERYFILRERCELSRQIMPACCFRAVIRSLI